MLDSTTPSDFVAFGKSEQRQRSKTWLRGNKTFSCSTQLGTKFIMLINVKMPTMMAF